MNKNFTIIYSVNNFIEEQNFIIESDDFERGGIFDDQIISNYLNSQEKEVSNDIIESILKHAKS